MIGAAAHTAAMLGVGGGCWERLVAPWGDAVAAGAVEQLSEQVHVCVRSRVTHDAK